MIDTVGLIRRGNEEQIAFAFEVYSSLPNNTETNTMASARTVGRHDQNDANETRHNINDIENEQDPVLLAETFKKTFSRDSVKIHFIGAWDTVSSVGIVRDKVHPHTADGMKHSCFFRHALALDERRVKFLPEYAYGGATLSSTPSNVTMKARYKPAQPHIKEVWFCGSHSDIGGGNTQNVSLNRGVPSLRWMSYEAVQAGLRMNSFEGSKFEDWDVPRVNESLQGLWWLLEVLPLPRLSYGDQRQLTSWPHLGSGRIIQPGQLIHSTVISLIESHGYEPRAVLPPAHGNWDEYQKIEAEPSKSFIPVERDLLNVSESLVGRLRRMPQKRELLYELEKALKSAEYSRALYDLSNAASASGSTSTEKPAQVVLSEGFSELVSLRLDTLSQSKPTDLQINLSLQHDIRIFSSFISVLDALPDPRFPFVRVLLETTPVRSNLQMLPNSAELHWSANKSISMQQPLEIEFTGSEFNVEGRERSVYRCSFDTVDVLLAALQQASHFYSDLRCAPRPGPTPGQPLDWPEPTRRLVKFRRVNPPEAQETQSWDLPIHSVSSGSMPATIMVGTGGSFSERARYSFEVVNDQDHSAFLYIFSFSDGLESMRIRLQSDDMTKVPAGNSVTTSDISYQETLGVTVTVYKVIFTDKIIPSLENLGQDRFTTEGVELWEIDKESTHYARTILDLLADADAKWSTFQFSVIQDGNRDQDSPPASLSSIHSHPLQV